METWATRHAVDCPGYGIFNKGQEFVVTNEVRKTSSTGGQKGSKAARFDLIPVGPLTDVAKLYGFGATKYDDRNWEKGYDWSLSYAALMRHVTQFWNGEDLDEETQLPHLASVVFHALAMMEWLKTHPEFDNRPKRAMTPGEDLFATMSRITHA